MIEFSKKYNRIEINLKAIKMGEDLCLIMTGGDTPHLGALTAASDSLGTKTIVFDTHKENFVTEMASKILVDEFHCNLIVCCGIHVDDIEKDEISAVLDLSRQMIVELRDKLKSEI